MPTLNWVVSEARLQHAEAGNVPVWLTITQESHRYLMEQANGSALLPAPSATTVND
jgi:hypothetical protein